MSKTDKHTVATAYDNDGVTDRYGRKHAQGSHDINRNSAKYNHDGSKAAWHEGRWDRKRGFARARRSKGAGDTIKRRSYPITIGSGSSKRTVYALDAIVRKSDGQVLKCTGFSDTPRREPTSALGKACAK